MYRVFLIILHELFYNVYYKKFTSDMHARTNGDIFKVAVVSFSNWIA